MSQFTHKMYEWHVKDSPVFEDGSPQHITGRCKSCNLPFDLSPMQHIEPEAWRADFFSACIAKKVVFHTPTIRFQEDRKGSVISVFDLHFEPTTKEQHDFMRALYRALTAGLRLEELPKWHVHGKREEWEHWRKELDNG